MLTNLRNVAIPGTGLPLSLLVRFKLVALLFLFVGYPVVSAIAGMRKALAINFGMSSVTQAYSEQLLLPQDWFSFWRLNCVVASYHAVVNQPKGFNMEDKWTFLVEAKKADVPVSPWLEDHTLVIKDKNEEGGMGIHFYKNAIHGGDWIIQKRLSNDDFVQSLLPEQCP